MRTTLLGVACALLLVFGAIFITNSLNGGAAQEAAAGNSVSQTAVLANLQHILEALRALFAQKNIQVAPITVPIATTTTTTNTTATSTASSTGHSTVSQPKPKVETITQPVSTESPTNQALALALPQLRSALVNIVCIPNNPNGTLKGVSGSGVIIDPKGIILTVSHVAQYELLAEARPDLINCVIRTGSPATSAYKAVPIYVSSAWINNNSQTISSSDPRGTGENDFALLAITDSATNGRVPTSFAYVPLSSTAADVNDPVVIGSYGAEFLTSARIRSDLFPTLVFDNVKNKYTFNSNTVDVISLGGNAAAQQGSSGGGIANQQDQLEGLITTSSSGSSLATRDLHAITSTYIARAFKQEMGTDLTSYVANGNNASLVSSYASKATGLANTLVSANGLK